MVNFLKPLLSVYKNESPYIIAVIIHCIARVKCIDFKNAYKKFEMDSPNVWNHHGLNDRQITDKLSDLGIHAYKSNGFRYYKSIKLKGGE